jgi:uncharacterized protein YkwD
VIRGARAAALLVLLSACGGESDRREWPPPPPPPSPPASVAPLPALPPPSPDAELVVPSAVDALTLCVDEINGYRAMKGLPLLARSAELDAYAATAARSDGGTRERHQYFYRTRGGGFVRAENQIPWWPLATGDARDVIREGTGAMWAEGPGGGHYENIVGAYTEVGCGMFVDSDRVTVVQAFR